MAQMSSAASFSGTNRTSSNQRGFHSEPRFDSRIASGNARRCADSHSERATLGWLAEFSSRHAAQWRDLQAAEQRNRRQRELLEWCDTISTDAGFSVQSERTCGQNHLVQQRPVDEWSFFEGNWDPSKHPRVPKGQAGGGQWTDKEGISGERTARSKDLHVKTAIYSGSKRIDVDFVSSKAVGHHWVALGATQADETRPFLSKKAVLYAAGTISGATEPPHRAITVNGISHAEYNRAVKSELEKFIRLKKFTKDKPMEPEHMQQFAELVKNGKGANGEPHEKIRLFNEGIMGTIKKGTKVPTTMEEILAAGVRQMKIRGIKLIAAGAVLSGKLGDVIADEVKILEVAASTGHYKSALKALDEGRLDEAQNLLIGDRDSLYLELVGKVSGIASLNFKNAMEKAFQDARNRDYDDAASLMED